MKQMPSAQTEFEALHEKFVISVQEEKMAWLATNRSRSKDVLEVMSPQDREEVRSIIARWSKHATTFAEEWWRVRGYEVIWPLTELGLVTYRKLESV